MPTKKGGHPAVSSTSGSDHPNKENVKVEQQAAQTTDDPFGQVLSAVEKKTRNLEKRKVK